VVLLHSKLSRQHAGGCANHYTNRMSHYTIRTYLISGTRSGKSKENAI